MVVDIKRIYKAHDAPVNVPEPTFPPLPFLYLELLENKLRKKRPTVNLTAGPKTFAEVKADNPEIDATGKFDLEEDEKRRKELYFRGQVLRRMHPDANVPDMSAVTDPNDLKLKYDAIAKEMSLNSNVDSLKRYLIIFLMIMEVGLGQLNLDVAGFAYSQVSEMSVYDKMLVELAEKSYIPDGESSWPVEVRLLGTLVINAAIFIVGKSLSGKTGIDFMASVRNLAKGEPAAAATTATEPTKDQSDN